MHLNTHNSVQQNVLLLKELIANRPYDDHTVDFAVVMLNAYAPLLSVDDFTLFAVFYIESRGPYHPDTLSLIKNHFCAHVLIYENYFSKEYLLFKFLAQFTYIERIEFSKFDWLSFVLFVYKQGYWDERYRTTLTLKERYIFEQKVEKWSLIKQKMFQKSVVK